MKSTSLKRYLGMVMILVLVIVGIPAIPTNVQVAAAAEDELFVDSEDFEVEAGAELIFEDEVLQEDSSLESGETAGEIFCDEIVIEDAVEEEAVSSETFSSEEVGGVILEEEIFTAGASEGEEIFSSGEVEAECEEVDATVSAAGASAAQEFTISETITGIKKASNGKVVYTKTFYADNTVNLKILAEHQNSSYQDYNFTLKLYGPNGTEVTPSSGNSYIGEKTWLSGKFSTAGNYTLKLTCGYTGLGTAGYKLTGELKKDKVYSYKFVEMVAENFGDPNNPDYVSQKPETRVSISDFDAPNNQKDCKDVVVFREANGQIAALKNSANYKTTYWLEDLNLEYNTKYTYYIVDRGYLTGTAKTTLSSIGTTAVTVTTAIKNALADPHVTKSNTITTKPFPVAPVNGVKVASKGVRWVEVTWARGIGYVQGYVLKTYNSANVCLETKVVNELGYGGTKIYIPYAGKSKVYVWAYYRYNGKNILGKGAAVYNLTSATLTAPACNVTKLSNTKASITTGRTSDAKGVQVQQKVGSKWVTLVNSTSTSVKKNWAKYNAGKSYYRVRQYLVDRNKKTYCSAWKTVTPKANQKAYTNWSVSYLRNRYGGNTFWYPSKISYSGNKLRVDGRFINTWLYASGTCKVKVTFKVDGKVVGTKTISSGRIGASSAKSHAFYLDGSVAGRDLYRVSYSVKYLSR